MKKTLTLYNIGADSTKYIFACGCKVKNLQRSKRDYIPYTIFNNPVEKELYMNWIELTYETAQYFNMCCTDLNNAAKGWEITFEFDEEQLNELRRHDELGYWLKEEYINEN